MYKVYIDGELLHMPGQSGNVVANPVLTEEQGKAGSFTCVVPVTNSRYENIKKLRSRITVYSDNERLWRGRVLDQKMDWNNSKEILAEGDLGLLNDSVIPPHTSFDESKNRDMTLPEYLSFLIGIHNSQVDNFKKFELGSVTVKYQTTDDTIPEREESGYRKTREIIEDLVKEYGGFLVTEPKTADNSSLTVLSLVKELSISNTQKIEFGKNLMTLERALSGADIYSVLIPTGKADSTGEPLTIEEATSSGGKKEIADAELVSQFGRIIETKDFPEIDDENELYQKGLETLEDLKKNLYKITLTAMDLSLINKDITTFIVGEKVRIISEPHGIDENLPITNLRLDLEKPENSEITVGGEIRRITESISKPAKDVLAKKTLLKITRERATNYSKTEPPIDGWKEV